MNAERDVATENMILKVRVGSHLFGTNTPESDLDYEGVFMPSSEMLYGFKACKEVDCGTTAKDESGRNTKDAVDFKIREYREFVRLALQNNPNILNMLFANEENIEFANGFGRRLLGMADRFPHAGGLNRYLAYGRSQMKKMEVKPQNYDAIKEAIEAISAFDGRRTLVEVVDMINGVSVKYGLFVDRGPGKHIVVGDMSFERGLSVKRVMSSLRDRIDRASSRSKLWEKYGYDVKFGANLIQILRQGIVIAATGRIQFPLKYSSDILDIKSGRWSLERLKSSAMDAIEVLEDKINNGYHMLPSKPRHAEIESFVIDEVMAWSHNLRSS